MATDKDDILIDGNYEDIVVNGDDAVDDGELCDCYIIVRLNKGEVKSDPMLGPEIIKLMNAHNGSGKMKQQIGLALEMDGKEAGKLAIKDGNIDFSI